jgi:hypothetical protein
MGLGLMRRADPERRARRLLRWYPKAWRQRYGEEFTQLLIDDIGESPRSWRRSLDVARGGLGTRVAERSLPPPKLAVAVVVLGAALGSAAALRLVVAPHQRIDCPRAGYPLHGTCTVVPGHGWVNPAVLVISLLGLAAAVSVLLEPFVLRLLGAAAICGLAAATMLWLVTYRDQVHVEGFGASAVALPLYRSLGWWTTAEAVLIGVAALGAVFVILRRHRSSWRAIAAAVLVLGASLGGAAVMHDLLRLATLANPRCPSPGGGCGYPYERPAWADSVALVLCVLGVAGGVGVLAAGRRSRPQ